MIRSINFALGLALLLTLTGCPSDGGTDDEVGTTVDTTAGDTVDETTGGGEDNVCAHQCTVDADCMVGGQDLGLTCQDSFCASSSAGCTGNPECVAQFSGWTMACTAGGGECDALGQVCVTDGLCATPPSDVFMCDTVPGWTEIETTDIDGAPVTVCGNPNAECHGDGYCFAPCQADADCTLEAYPVCDTGTGMCKCGSDADCATNGEPSQSVCTADGFCGCGDDQACVDAGSGDVCTGSGFCGCSGDAACAGVENTYDGGMISCVML